MGQSAKAIEKVSKRASEAGKILNDFKGTIEQSFTKLENMLLNTLDVGQLIQTALSSTLMKGIDFLTINANRILTDVSTIATDLKDRLHSKLDELTDAASTAAGDFLKRTTKRVSDWIFGEDEGSSNSNGANRYSGQDLGLGQSAFGMAEDGLAMGDDKRLENLEREKNELQEIANISDFIALADKRRVQAIDQISASFGAALDSAILGGEKVSNVLDNLGNQVSNVLKGIGQELFQTITKITIISPLQNAFKGFLTNFTSGFASGLGSIFGGTSATPSVPAPTPKPSFATGISYVPRDMTARLHKGEAVIPRHRAGAMTGGGNVSVNIINNTPAQVTQNKSRNSSGGYNLDIIVEEVEGKMARNIGRGEGLAPTVERRYGLNAATGTYR